MKILKKLQLKSLALWVLLFALTLSLFTGITFTKASAETSTEEAEVTYLDTEVEGIVFAQHPSCVFFGFKLADSDYAKYGNWEGDFAGTTAFATYEKYIAVDLTYWKNFSEMNSEGVILDQYYAYWDAGRNPNTGSYALAYSVFANTLGHRSTLERLNYGFVISIPAGTTFPSATYVYGKCQGTPIMYRTKTDVAFYYNGTKFEVLPYAVAVDREAARDEVKSIDLNNYYDAERETVTALMQETDAVILQSFSSFAVQDALATFYAQLDKIMTVEDYAALETEKQLAKTELVTFFNGLAQADYEEAEWNTILTIQGESGAVIDACTSLKDVDLAIAGVKLAVDNVLTKTEKAGFADYQAAAIARVENAFVESLYREAEGAQGKALVQEAAALIQKATSHAAVDGVALTYVTRIGELKTDAELTEEERLEQSAPNDSAVEDSATDNDDNVIMESDDEEKDSGCGSIVNGFGMIFGMAMVAMLVVINKKRMEKKNEK